MKGLNKITCCLLAALLMPCAGHAENEQYGANFNNADIRQFVEIVGQHLGKTILIDPSVQGTISVRSNDTFSQQEYYQFFLSILDLYGYSVITLDNGFLKVVRSANVKTSPGMIADSSRPGVGDELVTRIVPLENVPARDLAPLLRQMMDAGSVGNVVHYEPSNVLILTGRASTINKLIEVIKRVDVIGTEKQQIIHLEYASAEDLAEILNQLISESHGKSQMPALLSAKIVADKRTNSLIISGPEKARQRITSLLKSLDVEESEEGNTRVYYLKYAKATNLVEVLTGVSEKLKDEKGNARKPSSSGAMDIRSWGHRCFRSWINRSHSTAIIIRLNGTGARVTILADFCCRCRANITPWVSGIVFFRIAWAICRAYPPGVLINAAVIDNVPCRRTFLTFPGYDSIVVV